MSFFRYPGGKSKLRTKIVSKLNDMAGDLDLEYREPFFGGGSIGLQYLEKSKNNKVWINDLDLGIYCLWVSVFRYPEKLKENVLKFTPTVDAFYSFKNDLTRDCKLIDIDTVVNFGFKKLAIHQISYSGLGTKSGGPLGGQSQLSDYKIDCRWSPKYICKKIDKLNKQFKRYSLRFSGVDFSEVILEDTKDAIIYLDPPYFVKGNDLYQHGFNTEDHIRLANCLKNTKHKWLLSYDDCDEIRDLYSWATIEELDGVSYSITALKDKDSGKRTSRQKTELLISAGY
jgi:DNA adenine methylase